MNGMSKKFLAKLVTFRRIAGQPRAVVCDRLEISNSTYGRMRAILRNEAGDKTRKERFMEVLAEVEAFVGDRDPLSVSAATIARGTGCSERQAARARQAIVVKRTPVLMVAKTAQPPEIKPRKPGKLFWTVGDRLFSANRQPEEVECEPGWEKLKPARIIPIEEMIDSKRAIA